MKKVYFTPQIRIIDLSAEPVLLTVSIDPEPKPGTGNNRNTRQRVSSPIWSDLDE